MIGSVSSGACCGEFDVTDEPVRGVVLVEGPSDAAAVQTFAGRVGWDLAADGLVVMSAGGVTNFASVMTRLHATDAEVRIAGLYDDAEERHVVHALERAGFGAGLTRPTVEQLGFFVCVADLEDELIRAVGGSGVESVLESQGELRSFRRFQAQPAQRDRPLDQQLRRFMGTRSMRKIRYGRLLVDALDLDRVPLPLRRALEHLRGPGGGRGDRRRP